MPWPPVPPRAVARTERSTAPSTAPLTALPVLLGDRLPWSPSVASRRTPTPGSPRSSPRSPPACTTALQNGPTAREPRSQRQRRALRVDDRLHLRHARLHVAPGRPAAQGGRRQ